MEEKDCMQKALDRLLETIAWEELSLASLLQAEADKLRKVAAWGVVGPVCATDVLRHNRAVARVLQLVGSKEKLLDEKLRLLLRLRGRGSR